MAHKQEDADLEGLMKKMELENQEVVDIVAEALEKGNSVEAAANTVVETCLAHAASGCFGDV